MFNSFLNDRKQAQAQEIEKLKQRFIKDELLRKKSQEKLSKNYKKRVENFVIQMAEKPILTHDFVPPVVKIRDEDPSKFLGAPSIAVRSFKNEKDRIKENIQSYKEMRADYISGRFEFRKRAQSKEIQPMMRFTSKTNFERVANRLKVLMQNPNQDARALAKGAENLSDSFILELSKSPQATNKYLATHLLPDLNTNTHFKATYSLCLGIPDTIMDRNALTERRRADRLMRKSEDGSAKNASYNIFKGRNSTDQTISEGHTTATKGLPPLRQQTMGVVRFEELEEKAKESEKQMIIDTVNPVDVSKKVLVKCNIIRPKREGIKTLPKGGGHLMMSEKNLKEVYQELYQK